MLLLLVLVCLALCSLDYLIRAQELFEEGEEHDLLVKVHLSILAQILTIVVQWTTSTTFSNGVHYLHGRVDVINIDPALDKHLEFTHEGMNTGTRGPCISTSSYDADNNVLHLCKPLATCNARAFAICTFCTDSRLTSDSAARLCTV
jgi:hypothetical protein